MGAFWFLFSFPVLQITKVKDGETQVLELYPSNSWLLLYSSQITADETPVLIQKKSTVSSDLWGEKAPCIQCVFLSLNLLCC